MNLKWNNNFFAMRKIILCSVCASYFDPTIYKVILNIYNKLLFETTAYLKSFPSIINIHFVNVIIEYLYLVQQIKIYLWILWIIRLYFEQICDGSVRQTERNTVLILKTFTSHLSIRSMKIFFEKLCTFWLIDRYSYKRCCIFKYI